MLSCSFQLLQAFEGVLPTFWWQSSMCTCRVGNFVATHYLQWQFQKNKHNLILGMVCLVPCGVDSIHEGLMQMMQCPFGSSSIICWHEYMYSVVQVSICSLTSENSQVIVKSNFCFNPEKYAGEFLQRVAWCCMPHLSAWTAHPFTFILDKLCDFVHVWFANYITSKTTRPRGSSWDARPVGGAKAWSLSSSLKHRR